ncbi:MAG: hypothetical protein IJW67_02470 [Blautia sp.]|nr:hypothetical protein [Blautia sp.]
MRRKSSGSRSSLFLIELILSLLVFSLVSTVCIRLFAASWKSRTAAREWNHIQELTVNAAEILEAGDGQTEDFLLLFPEGIVSDTQVEVSFDSHWASCDAEHAAYTLQLKLIPDTWSKTMEITVQKRGQDMLYQQEIGFPRTAGQDAKGGDPS